MDRADDPRLLHLVAARPRHPGLHHWERTDELLERRRDSLARTGRPDASSRDLVAADAIEREPGVRRLSRGDPAPARRGAARVQGFSRAPAYGEGQGRVRPVHGGAPQPYRSDLAAKSVAPKLATSFGWCRVWAVHRCWAARCALGAQDRGRVRATYLPALPRCPAAGNRGLTRSAPANSGRRGRARALV